MSDPDPKLAALMVKIKPPVPIEKIIQSELIVTAMNFDKGIFKIGQRVVRLACGHTTLTSARYRCGCHECHKMIMRGEDYDAFRKGE